MPTRRYWVSGRVQGVFFRASTRDRARALGLRGYVRNLADGRVEVLAVGEVEALERLGRFLREGPPAASVDRVEQEDGGACREGMSPEDPGEGFHVRR